MSLPLLALLLLLAAARPGAALPERDGPGEAPEGPEEPAGAADFLSRQLQSLSELVSRELPPQLRPEELRTQAGLYLERANKQLEPLARELQNNVMGLFSSLLRLGRAEGQGETPETP
ncbi:uncharacterized protein LOC143696228 isoform X2 [Agelaius phoeniceus]